MRLWKNKKGATAIEYGLIASLIGVAAMTGFSATGTGVSDQFCKVAKTFKLGGTAGDCTTSADKAEAEAQAYKSTHYGMDAETFGLISDVDMQGFLYARSFQGGNQDVVWYAQDYVNGGKSVSWIRNDRAQSFGFYDNPTIHIYGN